VATFRITEAFKASGVKAEVLNAFSTRFRTRLPIYAVDRLMKSQPRKKELAHTALQPAAQEWAAFYSS
jgi:hypothetical protein